MNSSAQQPDEAVFTRSTMVNGYSREDFAQLDAHTRALIQRRERVLGAPYRLFYRHPIHVVRAEGTILYDADGLDYLDAYNNVPAVGHSNERVAAAVTAQIGTLNTHTRYLHDGRAQAGEDGLGRARAELAEARRVLRLREEQLAQTQTQLALLADKKEVLDAKTRQWKERALAAEKQGVTRSKALQSEGADSLANIAKCRRALEELVDVHRACEQCLLELAPSGGSAGALVSAVAEPMGSL